MVFHFEVRVHSSNSNTGVKIGWHSLYIKLEQLS